MNDDDKSMECFRTSAYSTTGDGVEITASSINSIDRLRRSGGSMCGGFVGVTAAGVACLTGLVLLIERDERRGFTSGGMDDEMWRTGGLGGGESSGDIAESTDFEMNRLRGDSFAC